MLLLQDVCKKYMSIGANAPHTDRSHTAIKHIIITDYYFLKTWSQLVEPSNHFSWIQKHQRLKNNGWHYVVVCCSHIGWHLLCTKLMSKDIIIRFGGWVWKAASSNRPSNPPSNPPFSHLSPLSHVAVSEKDKQSSLNGQNSPLGESQELPEQLGNSIPLLCPWSTLGSPPSRAVTLIEFYF